MHHGRSREEVVVGGKTVVHLVGYDDVPDMIADHPDLAALLDQHHLTAKQLYAAMMRRDTNLVRHTLRFKYQFPDDVIKSRKEIAAECLEKVDDVLAAARLVLDRMVFLDEGGFALSSLSKATHKVWGGKDDFKDCDVVHLPWVEGQKDCKVHWLIAVSCHPQFDAWNGIVFFEKTTGTTDIRRSINTMGQTAVEAYEYETQRGTQALSTVSQEISDLLYLIVRRFRRYANEDPIIVMDNNRIQSCIPDNQISSRYGTIDLPPSCRLRIPPHSPDFNQPAEHIIAEIKKQMRSLAVQHCARSGKLQPTDLQKIWLAAVNKIKKKKVYLWGVRNNILKMPVVWGIISTPKGQTWVEPAYRAQQNPPKKHKHTGSGGDWPPASWR